MNNAEIDSREVLNLFSNLSSKKQYSVYRKALTDGAKILQSEGKRKLKAKIGRAASHKNWWNGKTLQAGIKVSPQKDVEKDGVKVHIMGDFRLKFFEMGTSGRHTTGRHSGAVKGHTPSYRIRKPHYTGRMRRTDFFASAQSAKEKEIFDKMDSLILKNIEKVASKK